VLLAIDVGNTQTVAGLYDGRGLRDHWRTTSIRTSTADELAVILRGLLALRRRTFADVSATVISSTVPQLTAELAAMARSHLGHEALIVGPGVRTGMNLLVDHPPEVGPDRVANCVAAYRRFGGPCIVVDFGTGINFDAVSRSGDFLGGAIAPGLEVALDALAQRAARLPRVELRAPARAIGTNTVANMQSGAVLGCAGLVDALVLRFRDELGDAAPSVATGGLAGVVVPHCHSIDHVDPWLTLDGLRLIWERSDAGRDG
jgi:type III pantothenate kinase